MFSLRSFLTIVCLLCALAVSLISRCKTTGLDSVDPHAEFDSSTYEVARRFITALLKDRPSEYKSFALRKDSYTDKATGITHVFYRQLFKGIQVLNGDISVSVKDGAVISHGDTVSVVGGPPPLAGL
jgi:extracellular elastinolytic metalloproteinase